MTAVVACVVLAAGALIYVFYPDRRVAEQADKTRLEFLRERRDVLYDNLRDLNFEYHAGKYVDEDYHAQRDALEDEAALVVAEMGTLERLARRRAAEAARG